MANNRFSLRQKLDYTVPDLLIDPDVLGKLSSYKHLTDTKWNAAGQWVRWLLIQKKSLFIRNTCTYGWEKAQVTLDVDENKVVEFSFPNPVNGVLRVVITIPLALCSPDNWATDDAVKEERIQRNLA